MSGYENVFGDEWVNKMKGRSNMAIKVSTNIYMAEKIIWCTHLNLITFGWEVLGQAHSESGYENVFGDEAQFMKTKMEDKNKWKVTEETSVW
jgi:hypothetical protein